MKLNDRDQFTNQPCYMNMFNDNFKRRMSFFHLIFRKKERQSNVCATQHLSPSTINFPFWVTLFITNTLKKLNISYLLLIILFILSKQKGNAHLLETVHKITILRLWIRIEHLIMPRCVSWLIGLFLFGLLYKAFCKFISEYSLIILSKKKISSNSTNFSRALFSWISLKKFHIA